MSPATMWIESRERGFSEALVNVGQTKSTDVHYNILYIHDLI